MRFGEKAAALSIRAYHLGQINESRCLQIVNATSLELQGKVNFKEVGQNLYIVEFQDTRDLQRVQDGRPWSFNRFMLC